MKSFKRIIRLIGLALFLALALTGIGILGAVPIPSKRQEDFINTEVSIEMVDKKESGQQTSDKDVLY
nr:hypothetical protein [uncultured Mucilaginibacter sp.]